MANLKSSNPALSEKTFQNAAMQGDYNQVMTLGGTVNKVFLLLLLVIGPAIFTWNMVMDTTTQGGVSPWMWGGLIGGFVVALVTIFVPKISPFTAPVYALLEGLFLGALSAFIEQHYEGIALQAVLLTLGTLFCMLMAYKTGMIKVTEKFKMGVVAATGGIFFIYLISFVMSFFGTTIPYIHANGMVGIGFSLFVVVIAALNLVLDFDFIDRGVEAQAPKYMEWYAAFSLLVTLVWLYIEFLRLLSKLRD